MTRTRTLLALALGGLCGLLWTGAYRPVVHPIPLVVGAHALVGLALERALALARLRRPVHVGLGVPMGLLLGPAFVGPLLELGSVGGALAGAALALGVGLCALAGGLIGETLARWPLWGGLALLIPLGSLGGLIALFQSWKQAREDVAQPRAATVTSEFPRQRVAIIGIDGADWSVIDPMMAEGRLPTLKGLVDRGQEGVLRSITPTYSPVVWNTIFSGEPPEVHGLVDWYSSDARSRRVPLLWDIVGAHGRSSLTVNVPGTWPPAEVQNGVLLSGFPIPGLSTGDRGQLLGMVASTASERGAIPTERIQALGGGRFSMDLPLAAYEVEARVRGLRNPLLDLAVKKQIIALRGHRLQLDAELLPGEGPPRVRLSGPSLSAPVELGLDEWSSWLRVKDGTLEVVLRACLLAAGPDELRLYLTPAYQAPWAPRFPFATGLALDELRYGEPYVVEGLGWKAHRDPRVAARVPAALTDVEEGHVAAAERLLRQEPDLFSMVITITDRVQHPFWPLHAREDYAGRLEVPPGLEREDPVEDAYVYADLALARLLSALPEQTFVLVVSDHGFTSTDEAVEGEHRLEGIWIAAGPLTPASEERVEMNVADVVPTVLRCLGVPVARDMTGVAREALCPGVPAEAPVDSYRLAGDAGAHQARIDESREAQLKAMGYIEDEHEHEESKKPEGSPP